MQAPTGAYALRKPALWYLCRKGNSLPQSALGAATIFIAFCLAPAAAQPVPGKLSQMTTVHYAATGISFAEAPYLVAVAKKFFAAENLDVEYVVAQQSAQVCQQLLAKAVETGECSMNDVIQIVEMSGAPLVLVSNEILTALNYAMMTKPSIKTWADLKGKTIIVGGPKDNTVFYTRVMARANGLEDNDYQFQFAGASAARFAALKSGAVDAAMLTDPFDSQAEVEGYTRVDDLRPKYLKAENYAGGGFITTKDWAKTHSDEIVAHISALRKATLWIYDPANKDELFTILQPRINVTREAFDRTYQKNVVQNKMWATDGGVIRDSAVQGVVNSLVELGSLPAPAPKAAKYYDSTYVDLATASGQ
jgi:NitT/TauT family transport system substrate-binding protein